MSTQAKQGAQNSIFPQDPALADDWSLIGAPRTMPGFGYGFYYPSVLINVIVPPVSPGRRKDITDQLLKLLEAVEGCAIQAAHKAADRQASATGTGPDPAEPDDDGRVATLTWFAGLFDILTAGASLPVAQTAACFRAGPRLASIAIPVLLRGGQAMAQLAELICKALARPETIAGSTAFQAPLVAAFAQLRAANFPINSARRMVSAAAESRICFQELPGSQVVHMGVGAKGTFQLATFTEQTSNIASLFARQKGETAMILRRNRLPVPQHRHANSAEQAELFAAELGYPVVVKPADLDGGIAVQADLRNGEEVRAAYAQAREKSANILVEKFIEGQDYRLTVFRGKCLWAVNRQPGGVTGDGTSSIAELVDQLNADPDRGKSAEAALKPLILDTEALELLEREQLSLESVPHNGTFIRMRRVANISRGGTPTAVTDKMHPDNARLAVRAAEALRLDLAGVDLIIPDISRSWRETGGAICEVNAQPDLGGTTGNHLYPLILKALVKGDGHIPVIAVLGNQGADALSEKLAKLLGQRGLRAGLHNRRGIWVGQSLIEQGQISQLEAGQALSINPNVDLMILAASDSQLLAHGFPVPRIDMLVLTGEAVVARGEAFTGREDRLSIEMLRLLLPSVRLIVRYSDGQALDTSLAAAVAAFGREVKNANLAAIANAIAGPRPAPQKQA